MHHGKLFLPHSMEKYQREITLPGKNTMYNVHFCDARIVLHNQLGNPDFTNEMDFAAKEVRDENNKRRYKDFMSGDWAWRQSVCSYKNVI